MRHLLAIVRALLAAAAVHAVVLAVRGDGRSAPRPALMDERAGRLRAIEVHFAPTSEFVNETYREFFRTLPTDVSVYVAVERLEHADLFTRLTGRTATPVVIGKPITTWARDRFVTAGDGSIVIPPEAAAGPEARINDRLVPFAIARARGVAFRVAPFRFDGGDFTRAYGRIFASVAWAERNPDLPLAELLRLGEATLGEPIIYLPDAPRHHVGMVFAPVGENTFAVGDVRWGRRLAPEGFDADLTEETARRFDAVAEALTRAGYGVVRVPALPTTTDFAWVTYTNGLFAEKSLWMPTFGVPALDDAAAEVYRSHGFDVKPVDVATVFRKGGTLHCLVHVLARE